MINTKARHIIAAVRYIALATISDAGQPWNSPVAAVYDDDYNFYWASWVETQHSKNIDANGKVFLVVFDSTPANDPTQGVYISAHAVRIEDPAEADKAALLFKDDPYNPSEGKYYVDDKPRRIYKAVPQQIWLNEIRNIDGNFVDFRVSAEN